MMHGLPPYVLPTPDYSVIGRMRSLTELPSAMHDLAASIR